MLALPQLKALLKEHNLYRCYINKDEAIALLLHSKRYYNANGPPSTQR